MELNANSARLEARPGLRESSENNAIDTATSWDPLMEALSAPRQMSNRLAWVKGPYKDWSDIPSRRSAQPPKRPRPDVYFIGGEVGPIKIGTAIDIKRRLINLQSGNPNLLWLLATDFGGAAREAEHHRRFAEFRVRGEWFERTPELLAEIARLSS